MTTLKKFVPLGAMATFALVAVLGVASFTGAPTAVSAQEVAQKSHQAVTSLSAKAREQLEDTVGFESRADAALEEAQNAPDLTILTYEEWVSQEDRLAPPDPDGKLKTLQFLTYTKDDGRTVILGIDPDTNLPHFHAMKFEGDPGDGDAVFGPRGDGVQVEGAKKVRDEAGGLTRCVIEDGVEICEQVSE